MAEMIVNEPGCAMRAPDLLAEYEAANPAVVKMRLMQFAGVTGDVYNPSGAFEYQGATYVAGRYEDPADEFSARVGFFRQDSRSGVWNFDPEVSNIGAITDGHIVQDPSVSYVQGQYVVTVVDVVMRDAQDSAKGCDYTSVVYCGENLRDLRLLCRTPKLYKGVRVVELQDGAVGLFVRPQSSGSEGRGGAGKIAFTILSRLEDITAEAADAAEILPDLYDDDEWGGANDVRLLEDGRLAVLAHIARFVSHPAIPGYREYCPLFFVFDPTTRAVSGLKVLLRPEDIQLEASVQPYSKRPDLERVIYPAALRFRGSKALLSVGLRDTAAGVCEIDNPLGWS